MKMVTRVEQAASPAQELVSAAAIRDAAARLHGVTLRTPLVASPELSASLGAEVRLKCESLQRGGAFKLRGAYNWLSRLDRDSLDCGLIAASSGNHGQAVAIAAGMLGTHATVVMPLTAPAVKRKGVLCCGGEVLLVGTTSLERRTAAQALAAERGSVLVPGFEHPDIIAGQGTVGLEIVEEWPDVEVVLVPIGGGGLASGTAAAVKSANPRARIIGVEPIGAASMRAALDAGHPVTLERSATIADGLAANRVSEVTLAHLQALADAVVSVDDTAIREAAAFLVLGQKLVVEFAGAAVVAALRSGQVDVQGRRVAAVLSGGNLDPAELSALLAG